MLEPELKEEGDVNGIDAGMRRLAADVEGVSDGRMAAVPGEASTRQMSPGVPG